MWIDFCIRGENGKNITILKWKNLLSIMKIMLHSIEIRFLSLSSRQSYLCRHSIFWLRVKQIFVWRLWILLLLGTVSQLEAYVLLILSIIITLNSIILKSFTIHRHIKQVTNAWRNYRKTDRCQSSSNWGILVNNLTKFLKLYWRAP